MRGVLAGLISAFGLAASAWAAPVDTGRVAVELVPERASIAPGETIHVALRQKIDKGWHTYWRNPGDSGEPTRIAWTLPADWRAGEIVWPTPERQPTGPLVNYGYQGEILLPVPVTAPATARPGDTARLKAAVSYLVCEEICIPEDAVLELDLPVAAQPGAEGGREGRAIAEALRDAPKPSPLTAAFRRTPDGLLQLAVAGAPLKGASFDKAYFFPFEGTVIDHAKPQPIERGPSGVTLGLTPGYAFQEESPPKTLKGLLSLGDRAYEITAVEGEPPAGAAGLGPPASSTAGGSGGGLGLPAAVAFALLGGLILNLMPCVFPVLAMKAAGLARHAEDRRLARRHGLAFLAGVLATFLALAAVLIALQSAGAAVGWGFQLQSPPMVAALALVMLLVALNLSGVFEVGGSLQGVGTGLAARGGLGGAFFTGALAVVVAAPCTAPFMAPALGWALTQGPVAALAVFLALGLGFGAPFAAVAFLPGLLSRLPRPGPWMNGFRRLLAFPMYGAAAWLLWVLSAQAGEAGLARLLALAVVLALAAWLWGVAQRRRAEGARPLLTAGLGGVLGLIALAGAVWPAYPPPAQAGPVQVAALGEEAYSPERLAALRAEGRPVFVNFTADWCVTCKVNERVALSGDRVAKALQRTNTAYLKADWTLKDDLIAAELARHGRAGVPLYLVYGKSGDPVVLPQLLSEGGVVRALEEAAGL